MLDDLPQEKQMLPFRLYFDNLFTKMSLIHLNSHGYGATGSLGDNRLPKENFYL